MTAAEMESQAVSPATAQPSMRRFLAFGTGVGIEITGDTLEVAVVRARPGGPDVVSRGSIDRFRERPATEWSAQFREIVRGNKPAGVTILLPRHDVMVRHVPMQGVGRREMAAALALRLRGLHPFADDDVAWCWAPVVGGALLGITRQSVLGRYESLFAEAGIPVASFTFPAAVLYTAMRLYSDPVRPFLGFTETRAGLFEAYGEGTTGAIFSGEFAGTRDRVTRFGVSELRLEDAVESTELEALLPLRAARPLLLAAALTAACPLVLRPANFLPPERRAGQIPFWLIPTAVLALALIVSVIAVWAIGPYREKRYLATLHAEIDQATPLAQRAGIIDKQVQHTRDRIQLLDGFRARTRGDFDVLNDITRLLAPPIWTNQVEIYPDYVIISGEAEQAAPLLKILDASPLFHNSEFTGSVARTGKNEVFRIKTYRRRK